MALTKDEPRRFETGNYSSLVASTAIWQGAIVCAVRASGQAAGGAFAATTHRFAGIALNAAAIGDRVNLQPKGRVILTVAGSSAASVNAVVFASDDNTFTVSPASTDVPIGRIGWVQDDGRCMVDFDAAVEANQAAFSADGAAFVDLQTGATKYMGLSNTQVFRATPPATITCTTASAVLTVAAVATGGRDPILEIEAGMACSLGGALLFSVGATVLSVDTDARTVTMSEVPISNQTEQTAYFGHIENSLTVPEGVEVIYATYCGGGLGGAGGHTAGGGGGGGGGGASRTYVDYPLRVTPGEVLTIQVGIGGPGAAKGAVPANNGGNATYGSLDTAIYCEPAGGTVSAPVLTSGQSVPIARPNKQTAYKPAAGGATNGGKGGDGAQLYVSGAGGPAGGTAGTGAAGAGHGAHAILSGSGMSTGGAGGGGNGTFSATPGEGGTDTMHVDNVNTAEAGCGGAGGASHLGKGGKSGHSTLRDGGTGGDAVGYGAGGGGGKSNYGGGNGAPGIVILRW